jgi:hypothetical protein
VEWLLSLSQRDWVIIHSDCKGRLWERGGQSGALPPMLTRSLGHVVDLGELPKPCSRQPSFQHLSPEDLLPILSTCRPTMVFPTHATRSKWGTLVLTAKELGLCLNAPQWIISNPVLLKLLLEKHSEDDAIPLKTLQAPLQQCLRAIDPP